MRILPLFLLALLFTSCGPVQQLQSEVTKATQSAVDTTTNAVKSVEKKIQQGQEIIEAVETTKQKINAFQNE